MLTCGLYVNKTKFPGNNIGDRHVFLLTTLNISNLGTTGKNKVDDSVWFALTIWANIIDMMPEAKHGQILQL